VAEDGQKGLALFEAHPIHLVICDIRMPRMNGLELATQIRKTNTKIPIFITSSHSEREDLMRAIPLNIADYLIKPFTFSRLQEALRTCIQRIEEAGLLTVHLADQIRYNPLTQELFTPKETFPISGKEQTLLELLIRFRGRLVSREQIEQCVYGDEFLTDASLKNLVYKLRRKLGKEAITNVYSTGFILR
jgi:DNA-binding response OmpR family regulator